MNLFHVIEDGTVILKSRGLFRQAKVFHREGRVYAGYGSGFLRLVQGGGTGIPGVTWIDVEGPGVTLGNSREPKFVGAPEK